jgi:hypothetical protein
VLDVEASCLRPVGLHRPGTYLMFEFNLGVPYVEGPRGNRTALQATAPRPRPTAPARQPLPGRDRRRTLRLP